MLADEGIGSRSSWAPTCEVTNGVISANNEVMPVTTLLDLIILSIISPSADGLTPAQHSISDLRHGLKPTR